MKKIMMLFTLFGIMVISNLCVFANTELQSTDILSLDICNGSIKIKGLDDGSTQYTQNGTTVTSSKMCIIRQSDVSKSTSNSITLLGGVAEITIYDINISNSIPIVVNDDATLKLNSMGENILTGSSVGINVENTATIILDGTGSLSVTAGQYAGIGDDNSYSDMKECGNIIINGGTINAQGGELGAGIGGGNFGDGGNITINGGIITARGGRDSNNYGGGAGIGGGRYGAGGNITINGGTIKAVSVDAGAGIGGGAQGSSGNIVINGGIIEAYGSYYGAGIGAGGKATGDNKGASAKKITINGGTIIAEGGKGAGIGGGYKGSGGTIHIQNANITAHGGYCAIGGGYSSFNEYGCDAITVINSVIESSNSCVYQEKIKSIQLSNNSHSALINNYAHPSVTASSFSGVTYQWQTCDEDSSFNSDWSNVSGQTSETANIAMTTANNGHYYRCKLTNAWGNVVYTNSAQCFILEITKQPESIEADAGSIATLTVETSSDNVSYQWERSIDGGKSYTNIKDEIYSTLIVNAELSYNDALYRCIVIADNGDSLASDVAKITVVSPDVYYTEKFYLQNANNDNYTAITQNVVVSVSGTFVTASNNEYNGFVENVSLGKHSGTVTSDSSLILERYYDRKSYTITFNTNGGVVLPELTSKYGADILLPTPSRYGYSFEGWYTDNNLTYKADILTMPIDGATLYAKWNSQSSSSRGTEYKINALTLRNSSNYEEIKSIPASSFIAEISVTNLSSVYTDTIIVATYDENGALIDLTYMYASIDAGETAALGTLIKNTNGNVSKIKAFVWATLNSLKLLAESVEICK